MSDWREAWRATCGPLVEASLRALPAPFPRGADALRELAAHVERFADDDDATDDAERAFVEGAGASLALVLADHVGDASLVARDGAHRLRLGTRGFVDTFAIVAHALDADSPRRALRDAVARAEDEARDRGPVSRVMASVEARLADVRPELAVADRFEARLLLVDGTELDLRRLVDATTGESADAVAQAARKLVDLVPGGPGARAPTWEEARPRLVPRLVHEAFAPPGGAGALWVRPLVGDVSVALVLLHEDRARYVRAEEPDAWGVGDDGAHRAALEQLAARSPRARFARIDTEGGPIVVARSGDGLDAARLVLPGLHDVLAAELGSPLLVAVPHRDTLYACRDGAAALAASLAARVRDDHARAPHRISARLFRLGRDALSD